MPCQFELIRDAEGTILKLKTNVNGYDLLVNPRLNKGSAFSEEERKQFHLQGKLPHHVETLEEQVYRIYQQYQTQGSLLNKNIYLNNLHDTNETLFYRFVGEHLEEMLPIIYTPTISDAVEQFSLQLRRPRGLYLAYPDRDQMESMIANRSNQEIDLMVVTDGERVLGIGDQGIGGMNISIGKLMVYVLCAGVNPLRKLAITLDVGTNNQKLLNDPMYLGWKHPRITGKEYDDFIDLFVRTIRKYLPTAYLHWEDFGRDNARRNLERYREQFCSFNDDMQGTGAVTLAVILAGLHASGRKLSEERIVFFGAGTAGTGVADQLFAAMVRQGSSPEEAKKCFYLIDQPGLLIDDMPGLTDFQKPYARAASEINTWKIAEKIPTLLEVVHHVKPTILVGCSAVTNAFTEEVVRLMSTHIDRPIILPLSNPTSRAEAHPEDLYQWSNGKALVATGSPFEHITHREKKIRISQSNNAFIFPGIGLGVIACRPKKLTDEMIWAAAEALSKFSPVYKDKDAPLLPDLSQVREISLAIAKRIIETARAHNLATYQNERSVDEAINQVIWQAKYYPYEKMS
ncbi:MAG: NAD-dependent malic enzyme [Pseudomonadota bacterium]